MTPKAVLLDTSFFLRFLNENNPLFPHADSYFRYFLENNISMIFSTISVAEFCVGGSLDQLPFKNIQILPFNIKHAECAGKFADILFREREKGNYNPSERKIIPNDTKLFAQSNEETLVDYFVTSDRRSLEAYKVLRNNTSLNFSILDINHSVGEAFGILDFPK